MNKIPSPKTILPSDFATRILREPPYPKQAEIMDAIYFHPRVAVAAANGVGKTWAAARIAIWFMFSFPHALVITTAPTYRQTRYILWREIRYALMRLAPKLPSIGKLTSSSWAFGDRLAIGFAASDLHADRFQGLHSPNTLIIVDEASGISDTIFQQITATLRGQNSRLLLIGNPLAPYGPFFRAFKDPAFKSFKISAFDCPNVFLKKTVIPGLVTYEDVIRDLNSYGKDSIYAKTRIFAEFPDAEPSSLISQDDLDAAASSFPTPPPNAPKIIGADIAHGGNFTTIACLHGPLAYSISEHKTPDLTQAAKLILTTALKENASIISLDATGLGQGVADILKSSFLGSVIPVNLAAKPHHPNYLNKRTEIWLKMVEKIRLKSLAGPAFLNHNVQQQLLATSVILTPSGKLTLKHKIHPDHADALALAALALDLPQTLQPAQPAPFLTVEKDHSWAPLR